MKKLICIFLVLSMIVTSVSASASLQNKEDFASTLTRLSALKDYCETLADYIDDTYKKSESQGLTNEEFEVFTRYAEIWCELMNVMYLEIGDDTSKIFYTTGRVFEQFPSAQYQAVQEGKISIEEAVRTIIEILVTAYGGSTK